MSMTCHNLEFGRTGLEFLAYGCSSNASFDRISVRDCAKGMLRTVNGGYKGRKLWFCRRDIGPNRVFSTNSPEVLLNGVAAAPPPVLDLEHDSRNPASLTNLFEVVAEDLQTLNKNLQSIVGAENPVLMSAAEQIFGAGGKRTRPALVFLVSRATAEIVGLKELTKEHRQETVHQLYGTRVAVLAGDFMFAQSSWYLANLENLEVIKLISQVIKDFASGEIKQASSLFDCDVQLDEYLLKSYYKTASLIASSTKGAAIFSGVDSEISEQMYQYGMNFGLSFQVVDDILDFTQSAEQLGKPSGSDLAKGNLTAPVIFALEKETKLRDIIESEFFESGSLDEAIDIIKSCGGIDEARELAKTKADLALDNLQCLPSSSFRFTLEEMVKYNLERIK
ncbi:Solanesyl diphosphate synthase 2 [Forsythia ovata]|uniref:Solanesyl diphosphate synthase 2 n=1 Tax=Forsythia ovata TaxID=205694 RepID=A0ABD1S9P5_9LAMI